MEFVLLITSSVIDEKRVANSHVNSDGASWQLPIKTQGSLALGKGLFVCRRKQWVESIQQRTPLFRPLHWKLHRIHFPFNPIIKTAKSATFNYRGHRLNRQCLLPRVYSLVHERYWLYYFYVIYSLFIEISCSSWSVTFWCSKPSLHSLGNTRWHWPNSPNSSQFDWLKSENWLLVHNQHWSANLGLQEYICATAGHCKSFKAFPPYIFIFS